MALRIQLQDSQGSGCKIDARNAVLSVSQGIFHIGPGKHLSFPSGKLEVFQPGGSRCFWIGEGFASIKDSQLSLVTDRYFEFHSSDDVHSVSPAGSVLVCAVCGKNLDDTLHCISLNGKHVNLCCPHCAGTFRHAANIVRSIYDVDQNQAPEEPSDLIPNHSKD